MNRTRTLSPLIRCLSIALVFGVAVPAHARSTGDRARAGEVVRSFILKNVEGLKLENVRIGGQRVNGHLEWKQAAPQP